MYLFGFYIHVFNSIHVTMDLWFLYLSFFNSDYMLLNTLCNYYASYAYHIYIVFLIDKAYRTAVGYRNVQHTWEIWRSCLQTSSVKWNHQLSSTRNIGLKSLVQSRAWKLITAGIIIPSLSIPSNEQVSECIYLGFIYMYLTPFMLLWIYDSYTYHFLIVIICFSILYVTIMLRMLIIYTLFSW